MAIDSKKIRNQSVEFCGQVGILIPSHLPTLEQPQAMRTTESLTRRLLCMNGAAAAAYGIDKAKAMLWLKSEHLLSELSSVERRYLDDADDAAQELRLQVESMWVLAWAIGVSPVFDMPKPCPSTFVKLLPDIKIGQSSEKLKSSVSPRSAIELFQQCDLAYCIHWACREAGRMGVKGALLPIQSIYYRRKAFEWALGYVDWNIEQLDT